MHKCAHSLSFLCVHDARVSTVVTGGVVTGTKVVTCFHLVAEQSIGGLLSETCHSSLGSERMCISLERKLARSGKIHLRTSAPRWGGKPSCYVEQTSAHRGIRWQSSSARVSLSNRDLADQSWACITQGTEPQQRERAAGVKALCSMLAAMTSGRAKEIVK